MRGELSSGLPPLTTSANRIVAADSGAPVLLRGVNRSGLEYSEPDEEGFLSAAEISRAEIGTIVKEWGANIIRLAEHQPSPQSHNPTVDETRPKSAVYLIALKDERIHAATSYWADRTMLHYITLHGAHEQVRMDLVDRAVTSELNRQRKLEFRPEPRGHIAKR